MNLFSYSGLLTFITSLAFSVFSWVKGKKFLNKIWSLFCLCVALWGLGAFRFASTLDRESVFFWLRVGHIGVILMPTFFLHFIFEFLEIKNKIPVVMGYLLGFFFLGVNVTDHLGVTNLLITNLRFVFNQFYVDSPPGPWYPIFLIFYFGVVIASHVLAFAQYKKSSSLKQKQMQYFLAATVIGFSGGVTAFLMVFKIDFYPTLHLTVPLYPIIMSYAILNYRLMDIEVIIKKTLVFASLFAAIYGVFILVSSLGQRIFENIFGFNQTLAVIPTVIVVILIHEPLKKLLVHVTDSFLFQKKYHPAELIRAFTQEVMMEYDLNQITRMTTRKLSDVLRVTSCAIFMPDKSQDKFIIKDAEGISDRSVFYDKKLSPLIGHLSRNNGVVLKNDLLSKEVLQDLNKAAAELVLFIPARKETIGLVTLGKKKSDEEFTKEEIELLKSFSNALGLAMNTAIFFQDAMQKEKLITMSTMAASIRHDISTPINLMNMSIDLFLLDKSQGRHEKLAKEEFGSEAYSLMERCKLIFQKVVAISAKFADAAKPKSKDGLEVVAVTPMIEKALGVIGPEAKLKDIELKTNFETNLPPIECDEDYMQQVLFNILRNGMYAIKEAKRSRAESFIAIEVNKTPQNKIRIEITDTGTGIPQDKLNKIFEAYYTTKPEGVGTGLGLVVVKELTERMKGTVSVRSEVGRGTTFTLEFKATPVV